MIFHFLTFVTFNFTHQGAFCGLFNLSWEQRIKNIDLCNSLAKNYSVLTLKFAQIGGGFAMQIQISENCKTEVF